MGKIEFEQDMKKIGHRLYKLVFVSINHQIFLYVGALEMSIYNRFKKTKKVKGN